MLEDLHPLVGAVPRRRVAVAVRDPGVPRRRHPRVAEAAVTGLEAEPEHGWRRYRRTIGYSLLALGISLGLYFSYTASQDAKAAAHAVAQDRSNRSVELNKYLAKQCDR